MSDKLKELNAMSDEDFLNSSPEDFEEEIVTEEDEETPQEEEENAPSEEESDTDSEEDVEEEEDTDPEEGEDSELDPDEEEETTDTDVPEEGESDSEGDPEDDSDDKSEEDTEEKEKDTSNSPEMNYKEVCERIFAPFTANGVEWQVKTPDEVIRLMEMGANYHKKMAGLKPNLKTVRLLQNHDLLDPDKINYLIDLHKKKPEAITKLIKDSGIDVLEVDTTKESDYTPEVRTVSDTEYDLQEVMDSIKDTPTYTRTLNVVSTEWDEESSAAIANSPESFRTLNTHMADGTYDTIKKEIDRLKAFGQVPAGISDYEVYKRVGTFLAEQGQLVKPGKPTPTVPKETTKTEARKEVKKRKVSRKGAAIPTGKGKKSSPAKIDPLSLSDEEFEKFDSSLG